MKEFFKPTKLKIVLAGIFFVAVYFIVNFNNFISFIEKFDPFYTSKEHRQNLGIEIIEIPFEKEQKLYSMIEQTIMAGFQYYDTGNEKEFEKVKDLFLQGEYERIKKSIKDVRKDKKMWEEYCKIPVEISEVKFSGPKRYKNLENRIGIITLLPFTVPDFIGGGCVGNPLYIFIFKKIDSEQKIEKMGNIGIGWPVAEATERNAINKLLEEIKEDSKK